MTTIAYNHKDKQVAIDSRYTRDGIIDSDKGNKVRKNKKGLWLFAGHQADFEDLMKLERNQKAEFRPDCSAILISNKTAFVVDTDDNNICFISELDDNFSMGSGSQFALSAMDFGCSAKDAVSYAKKRDVYTGGKVRVFSL